MSPPFEGVGIKEAGGRWHSPGRAVVCASENRATAALEMLVHVRRAQLLRDACALFKHVFPDHLTFVCDPQALLPG